MHLKRHYKDLMITAGLTAVIGEIYFYPFGTAFRFTAGVIAISFMMLYFMKIPEMVLIPFAGAATVVFRIFLSMGIQQKLFAEAFSLHYPAFFFYLSYAAFLKLGRIRELLDSPVNFISVMTLSDMGANFIELYIRHELNLLYFQGIFTSILGVGLIRSIITFSLYWLMERYRLLIVSEEHQKRYAELLEFVSELKSELLYIKKTTGDLEYAMKEGYEIYRSINPGLSEDDIIKLKKKALNLAKDIHEIKKDYLRIVSGVRELLPEEIQEGMRISTIVAIIKSNTERWMKNSGKESELKTYIVGDLLVKNYFSIFSIINNLVSNALDAIDDKNGYIEIQAIVDEGYIYIIVADNGKGIDERDMPYIFEPGFSTKFNEDGSISTGLGLTHVKNLVEDIGGEILVKSKKGKGTKFEIKLPLNENFVIDLEVYD
ncbi:MAG: two-component system, sensor histidine kinase GlnK [Tepidanaerobacteraceae bacterium]|nr:two-component system, sensor histidine kinase GlnK [Tepidanaerobacteraceae bacterium]